MCIKVNTDGHGEVNTRTTMVIEVKVSRIWRRRTGLRPSSLLEWTLVSGLSVNCCSHRQGFVVSGFFVQKGKLEMDRWVGATSGGLPRPFMLRSCGLLSWLLCAEIMFFFLCTVDTAKHQQHEENLEDSGRKVKVWISWNEPDVSSENVKPIIFFCVFYS